MARFHGSAHFGMARFRGSAHFGMARFHSRANFDGAHFHGLTTFDGARFHGRVGFLRARFHGRARFAEVWARLDHEDLLRSTWPKGWTVRKAEPGDGRQGRWGKFVPVNDADPVTTEAATESDVPEPGGK
nr:pentapeptide repeat-containing protein [Actinopolyspora biskrensis]